MRRLIYIVFLCLLPWSLRAYEVPEMIPVAPVDIGTGDTSVLTSDSLPYTLDTDDRIYILSGNVTTTGSGITIGSLTNRILLDGQGDTVFFGTDGGNSYWGLRINGEQSTTDVHVRNITFYHNPDDSLADSTRACLMAGGIRVLCDTVSFHGFGNHDSTDATWARAIATENTNIYFHSWKFRGGTWSTLVWGFYSRLTGDGYTAFFNTPTFAAYPLPSDSQYHIIIDDVNLTGQGGINLEGRSWISACSMTIDQRNLRYQYPSAQDTGYRASCANQAGIGTGDTWRGTRWTNNYIVGGYDFQGMDEGIIMNYTGEYGVADSLTHIDSNYINAHFRLDPYYGTSLRAKCFASRYGNRDIRVFGNTFITEVGDTNSDSAWGPNGWVVKYNIGDWGDTHFWDSNYIFEDNRFEIVSKTTTINSGNSHFAALYFAIGEGWDSAQYDPAGAGVIWRNNYIKTPEWAYLFGGSDGGSQYMEIVGPDTVEFYVSDASIKQYTISCQHGGYGSGNYNFYNYVRDLTYVGTGEPDSLVLLISGYADHSAGLKRTVTMFVKDVVGAPVNGADFWAVNAYGDTVISTTTNGSGLASGIVKYWDIYSDFTDSIAYNDFAFGAQKAGDSSTTTFTVDWDTHTDTLTLSATGGNDEMKLQNVKSKGVRFGG